MRPTICALEENRSFAPAAERQDDRFLGEVLKLAPQVRAYALVLTRSADEADDLLQDVMLKVMRFRHRFEPGTNLRAWLYTIARNTYLSNRKAGRRMVQDVEGQLAGKLAEAPVQEWRVRHNELMSALDRLPAEARSLLLLMGAGASYEEAASICDCPVGTIRSRLNRARHRLQSELERAERRPRSAQTHSKDRSLAPIN